MVVGVRELQGSTSGRQQLPSFLESNGFPQICTIWHLKTSRFRRHHWGWRLEVIFFSGGWVDPKGGKHWDDKINSNTNDLWWILWCLTGFLFASLGQLLGLRNTAGKTQAQLDFIFANIRMWKYYLQSHRQEEGLWVHGVWGIWRSPSMFPHIKIIFWNFSCPGHYLPELVMVQAAIGMDIICGKYAGNMREYVPSHSDHILTFLLSRQQWGCTQYAGKHLRQKPTAVRGEPELLLVSIQLYSMMMWKYIYVHIWIV